MKAANIEAIVNLWNGERARVLAPQIIMAQKYV
jgi:hypothetical protein